MIKLLSNFFILMFVLGTTACGGDTLKITPSETPSSAPVSTVIDKSTSADLEVLFPDPNMEQAIRHLIGKLTGEIMESDLSTLNTMELEHWGINDITGIEYCNELTTLNLRHNSITEISPINDLSKLTKLDLGLNYISDIASLSNLKNLTELDMSGNCIDDISPLLSLTRLNRVIMETNNVTSLSPLTVNAGIGFGDEMYFGQNNLDWDDMGDIIELQLRGVLVGHDMTGYRDASGRDDYRSLSDVGIIPDRELQRAIRGALRKFSDVLTPADVEPITGLEAKNVRDLSDLEYCSNLKHVALNLAELDGISAPPNIDNWSILEISLDAANISDLSPLAEFYPLTYLSLGKNEITDLAPLSGLKNLKQLRLGDNQIEDLSPIASLTDLEVLSLGENQISDISALSGLTKLKELYISGQDISDISALSNLTGLTRLFARSNGINDITPLSSLTELTYLEIPGNDITDISSLSHLSKLTELVLDQNKIENVSALAELNQLRRLDIGANRVIDLSPLSELYSLENLTLWKNQIINISPLTNLTRLKWLKLSTNAITDISALIENDGISIGDRVELGENPLNETSLNVSIPLLEEREVTVYPPSTQTPSVCVSFENPDMEDKANFKYMGYLYPSDLRKIDLFEIVGFTRLDGIEHFTGLRTLISWSGGKTDLSPLSNLVTLTNIDLARNQISDLSHLSQLTNLRTLNLSENQINDIGQLGDLPNLKYLTLDRNQIVDILPLVDNDSFGKGTFISLIDNPLSDNSINVYVPQLEERGVMIIWE